MSKQLPELIDPLRLARRGQNVSGRLPVAGLKRVSAMLAETSGQLAFELRFARDVQGVPCVEGEVHGELAMVCQRCLQPMSASVNAHVRLGIATTEAQAENLPGTYEPLLVGDEPLVLEELVEDEVILALPVAPMHPEGECAGTVVSVNGEISTEPERSNAEKRNNPFAVLEQLKH